MIGSYHLSLALFSLLIAFALSYQLLDVGFRLGVSRMRVHRMLWLTIGTPTMALGLWAVHFVAMLTWLPHAIDSFNPRWSLGALLAATLACYSCLRTCALRSINRSTLALGSLASGTAVMAMHFMSLASIDAYPAIDQLWLALLTLVCDALPIVLFIRTIHRLRRGRRKRWFAQRLSIAGGFSLLIFMALHVALSAALATTHAAADAKAASGLLWLGSTVALFGLSIVLGTIILSHHCVRLYLRAQKLSGSVDRLHEELDRLATHDALTGLQNRTMLVRRIEQALVDARAGAGDLAIIYIDLDGFKNINDTLGHSFGDDLLRVVAKRLQWQLRDNSLARVGGDEFVAVVDRMRGVDAAVHVSERLIESMQQLFVVNGTELRVTPSIGLAFYPQDGETVEELITNANVAMYEAKGNGRNGYRLYNTAMKQRALRALYIQKGLQTAVEDGSLSLHFQPKHDGLTGVIVGAEALARWSHPELGSVSPVEFIAVAERSGQIAKIGEWVIREACRQLCIWRERGLPMVRIAINLSPLQLGQDDLPDIAARIVTRAGLSPTHIMFEVTESMTMQDAERTTVVLGDFRRRGFEFAIDDFGTGYSSLAYLQKFRVRQLKIDRFFVNALDNGGHEARAIITAIIALAHTLDMEVVAEGVETQNQMNQLRELGCDQVQGFLMSRPMPSQVFEQTCLMLNDA